MQFLDQKAFVYLFIGDKRFLVSYESLNVKSFHFGLSNLEVTS